MQAPRPQKVPLFPFSLFDSLSLGNIHHGQDQHDSTARARRALDGRESPLGVGAISMDLESCRQRARCANARYANTDTNANANATSGSTSKCPVHHQVTADKGVIWDHHCLPNQARAKRPKMMTISTVVYVLNTCCVHDNVVP
jgi:hypothetical protein